MKLKLINILGFIAFLIVLAVVSGAGWYLFNNLSGWNFSDSSGPRQETVGSESFQPPLKEISVKSIAGSIRVDVWENSWAEVEYRKRAISAEAVERLTVRMEQKGDKLEIWTEFSSGPFRSGGSVEYVLRVPGTITRISAKSVSGSIRMGENSSTESMNRISQNLETTSGSIYTAGSSDLSMDSVSGSLKFTSRGERIQAETVSGRITGVVSPGEDNHRIDLGSVSGSVSLDIPDNWGGEVELGSLSGSLKSRLPIILKEQSRTRLEGIIGEGDGSIYIKTTSGSVSVE